ncbi:MAG: response regulator receiver protein [Phycisphaerales bacterium]|nr:response regulator receiver protein [Phycisphaerales bacterium]
MKVLLVDDSKTMRTIQKRVLEGLGAGTEFLEAGDGFEALSAIASAGGKVDLVLVDWNMPNMDGLTLVQRIREKDKATPLVMCTTEAEKERVIAAAKAGISGYVVKPFDAKTLLEKVQATLARMKPAA